jgi:FkbM family methyltransferase
MQVDKFAKEFGMVYTFEPDPINFQCLVANLPYSNVVKIQACVADQHKLLDVDFFVDDIGSIHVKKDQGKIPTFKIDDLALSACDLIQLDVEGFEYFAVMGALETIKKFKPVLCLEFTWLQRYGVDPQVMLKLLTSLGYEMVENYTNDYIFKFKKLSFSL